MDSLFYTYNDIVALGVFIIVWILSTVLLEKRRVNKKNLTNILITYRKLWMVSLLSRDNTRIVDSTIINTLRASASFFASTSVLIIAGLITGLASSEKGVSILSTLPFIAQITRELWEIKMLFLIIIFTYAFFEFTWSLRMYNFSCVLIGSAPSHQDSSSNIEIKNHFINTTTHVISKASMHFNSGMRAYYFSLAALTWFINPIMMIISGVGVLYVLYHREFKSDILHILRRNIEYFNKLKEIQKN